MFFIFGGLGKATGAGIDASYSVMQTKYTSGLVVRVNSLKSGSTKARVISRGRSPRKLKNTTPSPSEIVAIGSSFSLTMAVGSMNSSVTLLARSCP